MTGTTVDINTLSVDASAGGLLTVGGGTTTSATVTGCNFSGGVLTMAAAGASATNTVATCTFTTKNTVGLNTAVATTVTGSTFNTTAAGTGITSSAAITASGDTFTGSATTTVADYGISLTGGTSTIGTSTFTNLYTALTINGAGVTFNGNTVTACGNAASPATASLVVTAVTGTANFYNNNITGGLYNIISVAANANLVNVMGNTFGTNAKAASSADLNNTLNVTRNYWGGAANNPASVTLVAGTTAGINYGSPLGAAFTASVFATSGTSLTAAATVGVNISGVAGATSFGATALSANPVTPALPSNVTLIKYFDVFANGPATAATVDFYGTTASPVTSTTGLYFYNAAFGTWSQVTSATLNTFAGYCEVVLPGTPGPSFAQFTGCAFALVNILGVSPVIQGTIYRANGASLGGVTLTLDGTTRVTSDANGTYQIIATTTGFHTIMASETGYRNQTQTIDVTDLTATYPLDFMGDNGLVPNAPNVSFVLACINKWS